MTAMTSIHLRLSLVAALLLAGLALPSTVPAQGAGDDAIRQTLEQARESGTRSVTVHANGHTLALLVTAIQEPYVIGRSAQHERIVVRIDRIDAVAF